MVTFAIFHLQTVFVQMIRTLVVYQPIPTNFMSNLRRHSPLSHDVFNVPDIYNTLGEECTSTSKQAFFCSVYYYKILM